MGKFILDIRPSMHPRPASLGCEHVYFDSCIRESVPEKIYDSPVV